MLRIGRWGSTADVGVKIKGDLRQARRSFHWDAWPLPKQHLLSSAALPNTLQVPSKSLRKTRVRDSGRRKWEDQLGFVKDIYKKEEPETEE